MDSRLRQTFESYRSQLEHLESQFVLSQQGRSVAGVHLASTTSAESTSPGANTTARHIRHLLPQPDTLYPRRYSVWLPYILAKLRVDGPAIGNEEVQFWYIYACLAPEIQIKVVHLTRVSPLEPRFLLERLEALYGKERNDRGQEGEGEENEDGELGLG